jgi:hypothetical protein
MYISEHVMSRAVKCLPSKIVLAGKHGVGRSWTQHIRIRQTEHSKALSLFLPRNTLHHIVVLVTAKIRQ